MFSGKNIEKYKNKANFSDLNLLCLIFDCFIFLVVLQLKNKCIVYDLN